MNIPRKKAAIFDLDGTLVDSMPLVIETFIHAVSPFRETPSETEVLSNLGGPLEVCLRNLLGSSAAEHFPAAKQRLFAYENHRESLLVPFPGARALLEALRSQGVKIGLWTGRDRWSAEKILKEQSLAEFFPVGVYGDDLATHKPDPEGLLKVIAELGVEKSDVVFLGDADADIIAGSAAGVHTVLIHHGRDIPEAVKSLAAEIVALPNHAYLALTRHF